MGHALGHLDFASTTEGNRCFNGTFSCKSWAIEVSQIVARLEKETEWVTEIV
jgi:hypothetical protein